MAERRGGTIIQSGEDYRIVTGGTPLAVKARPGVLGTISVTSAVTGSVTVHDNPSAASGPLIYSAATPAVGTVVALNFRCHFGIFVTCGSAGTVAVSFQ
jgi:hypothetical protein